MCYFAYPLEIPVPPIGLIRLLPSSNGPVAVIRFCEISPAIPNQTIKQSSLASGLHLKARGTIGVGGVATYARSTFAYLDLVEAGAYSVPNALVVIQELAQLKAADPRIRGILG